MKYTERLQWMVLASVVVSIGCLVTASFALHWIFGLLVSSVVSFLWGYVCVITKKEVEEQERKAASDKSKEKP